MLSCPECRSKRIWRDGLRKTVHGDVQRYLCRSCGLRFSESTAHPKVKINVSSQSLKQPNPGKNFLQTNVFQSKFSVKPLLENSSFERRENVASHTSSKQTIIEKRLNAFPDYNRERQVCAPKLESKNLAEVKPLKDGLAGATEKTTADIKGKLINFAWQLKKNGLAENTIKGYMTKLDMLRNKGANLLEPESVKGVIALHEHWSQGTKYAVVQAYKKFADLNDISWKAPRYRAVRKKPFIPLEKEIDALIACCGKKTSTILQLLKETGMRIGEALRLNWIDIDFERNIITLNHPEKNGETRQFKASNKLIAMVNSLSKEDSKVFGRTTVNLAVTNLRNQRKRAAAKLQNPRLLRITFHTLRHWKATMEYQKTKDILHVMRLLGHRNINNTLIYTQLVTFESDEYHSATAKNVEEARKLIEEGFEYVCEMDDLQLFRKRK